MVSPRSCRPETDQQWDVLRWELRSFVCDGEYARGLERILDSFLTNLSQAQQPAVWVSGFYGSGKSHLVRVLEYLWRDIELPSGERARSLVTLPDDVERSSHRALDGGQARAVDSGRLPGRWPRGRVTPSASPSCRCCSRAPGFLSSTLPARFVIWAHGERLPRCVAQPQSRPQASRSTKEVHDLYVSPVIAKALLDADASLGDSRQGRSRAPQDAVPADDQRTSPTTRCSTSWSDVLRLQSTTEGKLPLTLVVLDEMQQYIGDDNEKALAVQNIVEGCSLAFESQVLFVATGQSALTATPTLQKLTDRFAVQVRAVRQGRRDGRARRSCSARSLSTSRR